MSMLSGIGSANQVPVHSIVNRAPAEGSAAEESRESAAEKAREAQTTTEGTSSLTSSKAGVGQTINRMA
jgi:hypothetical protein